MVHETAVCEVSLVWDHRSIIGETVVGGVRWYAGDTRGSGVHVLLECKGGERPAQDRAIGLKVNRCCRQCPRGSPREDCPLLGT